jgi:hypothetical protein
MTKSQLKIQIVDTHKSLETRFSIGLAAGSVQINRLHLASEPFSVFPAGFIVINEIKELNHEDGRNRSAGLAETVQNGSTTLMIVFLCRA